jgi:polar amino acid transport system substrate-binding protein
MRGLPARAKHQTAIVRHAKCMLSAIFVISLFAVTACGGESHHQQATNKTAGSSTPAATTSAATTTSALSTLHSQLSASVRQAGVIKVATDMTYPPLDYYKSNGSTPTGADYQIGQAIGQALGVHMQVTNVQFGNIIPSLTSGQENIAITFMTDTPAREKAVDFIDEYRDGSSILVKEGNPLHIANLTDLCGKTISTTLTSVQIPLAQSESAKCKAMGKSPINILTVQTDPLAQLQVESGRAAADLADSVTAAYDAKIAGSGHEFEVVPGMYGVQPVGITVPKGDTSLRNALVAGLTHVISDGAYNRILTSYGLQSIAVQHVTVNAAG